jgi:hypothetical protein
MEVIIYQNLYNRDVISKEIDKVFLFGDNTYDRTVSKHIPTSTQAVIRGLSNAIGIDTKKTRYTDHTAYLSDNDFEWFKTHVDTQIKEAIDSGKTIVIPSAGIGTGKSKLKEKAPICFDYLSKKLNILLNGI